MTDDKKTCQSQELAIRLLALSLVVVAAIALAPTYFTSLQADEFCRSVKIANRGVVESVEQEYFHWSGRWFGIGLEYSVLDLNRRLPVYGWTLALVASFYWLALASLSGAVFPDLPWRSRFLLAGVVLALYWVGLPSTKDTCYWLCGAVEYQLNLALAMFSFSLTILAARQAATQKSSLVYLLPACLLAFILTGIHELYALMFCLVLLAGSGLAFVWKAPGRWVWIAVSAAALVGFLVTFLAPGNAIRVASHENFGNPVLAFKIALTTMAQTLPDWVFDFRLIVATLLLILLVQGKFSTDSVWKAPAKRLIRWTIPLMWLMLLGGAFLGPAWGTGTMVASRTLAPAYMIFLLGWLLCWLLVVAWLETKSIQLVSVHPVVRAALFIALAVSLLLTGNSRRAMRELSGPLPRYAAAKQARHELLLKAGQEREQTVIVPALDAPSDLIGFGDLTPDENNWINNCAAAYYGVRKIDVSQPE